MKRRDVLKGLAALVAAGPAVAEAATKAPAPVASESGFVWTADEHTTFVGLDSITSGALFDFLGFLTTRDRPVMLSGHHDASQAVQLLEEWARSRELDLSNADVGGWNGDRPNTTMARAAMRSEGVSGA